uniref:Uncharacterized protein n=1 Tax=Trichogramma kaykai TaxID=54128 RepID=A0ABD2WPJ0_9HYME
MWNTLANWWEYKVKDVLTLKGVGIKEYNGFYGLKSFASTVISKDEDNDKTINGPVVDKTCKTVRTMPLDKLRLYNTDKKVKIEEQKEVPVAKSAALKRVDCA